MDKLDWEEVSSAVWMIVFPKKKKNEEALLINFRRGGEGQRSCAGPVTILSYIF